MTTDDLESELRNLRFAHATETELVSYRDQELSQSRRARIEAHLKGCFICERQLELVREEKAAMLNRVTTPEDVAFVDRLLEQIDEPSESAAPPDTDIERRGSLRERLEGYSREIAAGWRAYFMEAAMQREAGPSEELWRWESKDGLLQVRAVMEQNADLTIRLSSRELRLAGARVKVRLGLISQEVTLQHVSESEIAAKVAVPWQQRQSKMSDLSIEFI